MQPPKPPLEHRADGSGDAATPRGAGRVVGECWALTTFDVGLAVDVVRALTRLADGSLPGPFRHRRSATIAGVGRCLRLSLEVEPLSVGSFVTAPCADVTLHEFGAATIAWSLPLSASAAEAAALAGLLHDNATVERAARELAHRVVAQLGDAVSRPNVADAFEDYLVFHLRESSCGPEEIASILRAEPCALSEQEVASALDAPIAYGPDEICYVDWLAALLVGQDMEDELRVLELANVALLELRVLDLELTTAIESSYGAFARGRFGLAALSGHRREVERVSRMQADSALMQENVRNAHKLVGDDYLARLYGRAARRFRLDDWDTSTTRKLSMLASVIQRLIDVASQRRSEILEWIIIALIALDLVAVLA
jgi:hypothetical protein